MKKILLLCMLLLCMAGLTACGQEKEAPVKAEPATAVFQTSMGDFEVKLATDYAPKTSENFIALYVTLVHGGVDCLWAGEGTGREGGAGHCGFSDEYG